MIDLVVSDLDETFLAEDKSVTEVAHSALTRLDALGIHFVPATGRSVEHVPDALTSHSCVRYVIGANGAAIKDLETGELIYERTLKKEALLELADLLRYEDVSFDLFTKEGAHTPFARYDRLSEYGIDPESLGAVLAARERVETDDRGLIESLSAIEKVTLYAPEEEARQRIIAAAKTLADVEVTSSHPKNVELMGKYTSKGQALVFLAAHLGVSLKNTLTFGDSPNDILMLAAAGNAVCPENALPEVKAVADGICASNNESGCARYILDALALGL